MNCLRWFPCRAQVGSGMHVFVLTLNALESRNVKQTLARLFALPVVS